MLTTFFCCCQVILYKHVFSETGLPNGTAVLMELKWRQKPQILNKYMLLGKRLLELSEKILTLFNKYLIYTCCAMQGKTLSII